MSRNNSDLNPTSSSKSVSLQAPRQDFSSRRPPLPAAPVAAQACAETAAAATATDATVVDKTESAEEKGIAISGGTSTAPVQASTLQVAGSSCIHTAGSATLPPKASTLSSGIKLPPKRGQQTSALQIGPPNYVAIISKQFLSAMDLEPCSILLRILVDGEFLLQHPARVVRLNRSSGKTLSLSPGVATCKELLQQGMMHVGFSRPDNKTLDLLMASNGRRMTLAECMERSAYKAIGQSTSVQHHSSAALAACDNPAVLQLEKPAAQPCLALLAGTKQDPPPRFASHHDIQDSETDTESPCPVLRGINAVAGDHPQALTSPAVVAAVAFLAAAPALALAVQIRAISALQTFPSQAAAADTNPGQGGPTVGADTAAPQASLHGICASPKVLLRTAIWHSTPEFPDGIYKQQSGASASQVLETAVPTSVMKAVPDWRGVSHLVGLQRNPGSSVVSPPLPPTSQLLPEATGAPPTQSFNTAVADPLMDAHWRNLFLGGMLAHSHGNAKPAVSSGASVCGMVAPTIPLPVLACVHNAEIRLSTLCYALLEVSQYIGLDLDGDILDFLEEDRDEDVIAFFNTRYADLSLHYMQNNMAAVRSIIHEFLKKKD